MRPKGKEGNSFLSLGVPVRRLSSSLSLSPLFPLLVLFSLSAPLQPSQSKEKEKHEEKREEERREVEDQEEGDGDLLDLEDEKKEVEERGDEEDPRPTRLPADVH